MPGPICSKLNEIVSERDVKISVLKYGKCIDIFAEKMWVAFALHCSKNINVFENILAI